VTRLLVAALEAYKRWLSPLFPRACRFSPTCSEYARLAFLRYGFLVGGVRATARVCRCHPLHPGGIDLP
jgi:putative membrane protein insertion efficiency factor